MEINYSIIIPNFRIFFSILISLLIHFAVIAGIPDFFIFYNPADFKLLVTTLETEKPLKAGILRMVNKPSGKETYFEEPVFNSQLTPGAQEVMPDAVLDDSSGDDGILEPEQDIFDNSSVAGIPILNNLSGSETVASADETDPIALPSIKENAEALKTVLVYDIYWLGVYVGSAKYATELHNGTVKISSEVRSAPVISALYKVEDYSESILVDNKPAHFRILQHEGSFRSHKETIFDKAGGKLVYLDHLNGTNKEYPVTSSDLWDMLSGFHYLRSQPLEPGRTVFINVFDSNKFYTIEVEVLKKEPLELFDKSIIDTIVVKPIIKSEGLFQRKGDVFIWLSDDDRKIPVRVETEVSIGKVVAKLKGIEE